LLAESTIPLIQELWSLPGSWGEFRAITKDDALRPLFLKIPLRPDHLAPALSWAASRNRERYNIYFGVNPRKECRGRNQDVAAYSSFIADIDDPEGSWPACQALAKAGVPASACVRTSRGLHLYWLLNEPEEPGPEVRERMRRLQLALNSDPVHDPARILRLPGSVCWKMDTPREVYLAWLDGSRKYSSSLIDAKVRELWPDIGEVTSTGIPEGGLPVLGSPMVERRSGESLVSRFAVPIPRGQRSEYCLAFINSAMLLGWRDEAIKHAILTLPIGEHYVDRGAGGPATLEYDIRKAARGLETLFGALVKVRVDRASIWYNPPETPPAVKLKLNLKSLDTALAGIRVLEWITPPRQAVVRQREAQVRWDAFCSSVGWAGPEDDLQAIARGVEGRELLINLATSPRPRALAFLPLRASA